MNSLRRPYKRTEYPSPPMEAVRRDRESSPRRRVRCPLDRRVCRRPGTGGGRGRRAPAARAPDSDRCSTAGRSAAPAASGSAGGRRRRHSVAYVCLAGRQHREGRRDVASRVLRACKHTRFRGYIHLSPRIDKCPPQSQETCRSSNLGWQTSR